MRKFWNIEEGTGPTGAKTIDILIFGEIDSGWFCEGVDSTEIARTLTANKTADLSVKINSVGGGLFGGITLYNLFNNHGGNVEVEIVGLAASSASIIAMAGDRVVMRRGAMMMIHNPMTVAAGDAAEMRKAAEKLDAAQASIVEIYKAKTGKTAPQLRALLDAETWMTAEEAKREGFVDEIDEKATVKNALDGDFVIVNSVSFARTQVPAALLASLEATAPVVAVPAAPAAPVRAEMKKGPCNCASCGMDCPCGEEHCGEECSCSCDKGVEDSAGARAAATSGAVSAAAPAAAAAAAPASISIIAGIAESAQIKDAIALLEKDAPALVNAIRAAATAAERTRLQAIDDLGLVGHEELITAAKYGEAPQTAEQLALAVIKAERAAGGDMLAARRRESAVVARVRPTAPNVSNDADVQSAIDSIAAGGSARRGGSTR